MSERPVNPTEFDVVAAMIELRLTEVHTCFPGRVERYDHDAQTIDVQPMIKLPNPLPDGTFEYEDLPVITAVRVLFPRSRWWFLAFGLDEGDSVLVHTTENAFAAWRASANTSPVAPGDLRRHHLANSVAQPGLYVESQVLAHAPTKTADAAVDAPALVIGSDRADGTRVTMHLDGSLKITQGETVVFQIDADGTNHAGGAIADNFVALANLVNARLSTIQAAFDAHTQVLAGTAGPFPIAGTATPPTSPIGSLASVAATKAKAT